MTEPTKEAVLAMRKMVQCFRWDALNGKVSPAASVAIDLETALTASEAREAALRDAILWALGCNDEFPPRGEKQGAYWWRTELAKRAGITNDDMTRAALVTP